MCVMVVKIFGGSSSAHSSSLVSFYYSESVKVNVMLKSFNTTFSLFASATSVAELENVFKTIVCLINFYSHWAGTLLLLFSYFSDFISDCVLILGMALLRYHELHLVRIT